MTTSTIPQQTAWGGMLSTNLEGGVLAGPLRGKLAIITGASRGIGAAVARNLASKGASLVLNFTSESSLLGVNRLATEIQESYNVRSLVVKANLSSPESPKYIVDTARRQFTDPKTGKFQIDIIVNNAGVAGNVELEGVTPAEFSRQYTVNVLAPLLLVQAALSYLPNDRSGRIVNISSISSSLGLIGQSVYGGTKAALEAMTRTWARELAERATVNAVNPGPVDTDMYITTSESFKAHMKPFIQTAPLQAAREDVDDERVVDAARSDGGRPARDYEIAGIVGMLCSEESGWCTGSVVCANGGMKFSV